MDENALMQNELVMARAAAQSAQDAAEQAEIRAARAGGMDVGDTSVFGMQDADTLRSLRDRVKQLEMENTDLRSNVNTQGMYEDEMSSQNALNARVAELEAENRALVAEVEANTRVMKEAAPPTPLADPRTQKPPYRNNARMSNTVYNLRQRIDDARDACQRVRATLDMPVSQSRPYASPRSYLPSSRVDPYDPGGPPEYTYPPSRNGSHRGSMYASYAKDPHSYKHHRTSSGYENGYGGRYTGYDLRRSSDEYRS